MIVVLAIAASQPAVWLRLVLATVMAYIR
jgi:hypothetical protein